MKVLYAIQGTGNGHISRAREIVPILKKKVDLDVLVSGIQNDVELPYPIKYKFYGLSFIFGRKGGVDLWNTYMKLNLRNLLWEINDLPVETYDLVINDFEPVSAWACYKKKIPCVSLSHQTAVLAHGAPQPKKTDSFGKFVLQNYAPTSYQFGFHFNRYNENIFTPVIRSEIRNTEVTNKGHYTVYLPAYDDNKLMDKLSYFPDIRWEVFSKHNKEAISYKNIHIQPINNEAFIKSMASSAGVLCGAGFETPAEAMYMGKKLMVIPMRNQYEQFCNAQALKEMGILVIKKFKEKHYFKIRDWLDYGEPVEVDYPDLTEQVIDKVISHHISGYIHSKEWEKEHSLITKDMLVAV